MVIVFDVVVVVFVELNFVVCRFDDDGVGC